MAGIGTVIHRNVPQFVPVVRSQRVAGTSATRHEPVFAVRLAI